MRPRTQRGAIVAIALALVLLAAVGSAPAAARAHTSASAASAAGHASSTRVRAPRPAARHVRGRRAGRARAQQATGNIRVEGSAQFVAQAQAALGRLRASPVATPLLNALDAGHHTVTIKETQVELNEETLPDNGAHASDGTGTDTTIMWHPTDHAPFPGETGVHVDPDAALLHELQHSADADHGTWSTHMTGGIEDDEIKATRTENAYRAEQQMPVRTTYGGTPLPPAYPIPHP